MNHIKLLFWVDLSHMSKHNITYMHSACMSGRWFMDIMTLDCTLQRALWSCADVMICQLSFTVNKPNKTSHLSSTYMQCIQSIVEILFTRGTLGKKFRIWMYRSINKSTWLWLHLGQASWILQ